MIEFLSGKDAYDAVARVLRPQVKRWTLDDLGLRLDSSMIVIGANFFDCAEATSPISRCLYLVRSGEDQPVVSFADYESLA